MHGGRRAWSSQRHRLRQELDTALRPFLESKHTWSWLFSRGEVAMPRKTVAPVPQDDLTTTLELVPLADLRPHPRNDGAHPPEALAHLKQSLTEHGVYRNVVVAQDGTLLAGHGVVEAAQALGHTHIAVQRLPYPPDDPRSLQVLVGDNHIARLRMQDDAALVALLQELAQDDPLALLGTGFDEAALKALAEQAGIITPDFQPVGIDEQGRLDEKSPLECPACGHTWVP
jgi:ParB family chromosome partitioning protein